MRRKLPLFDDKARTDPAPSYARESTYAFLDRVDDPIFVAVREVLNAWGKPLRFPSRRNGGQ
jgi:hypothetical protein